MTLSRDMRRRIPAIAVLASLLTILAAGLLYAQPWRAAEYHAETFCPKSGEYQRTAILIDATDSLDETHIGNATKEAENFVRNKIASREWTGVFVLNDENLTVPAAQIALCNPGGKSECNPLFENCGDAGRAFKKKFEQPLIDAIDNLAGRSPGDNSPILEMIRDVARAGEFNSAQERRLIIVSDMLQHIPGGYSHYSGDFDFAEWRESEYARDFLRPLLSGVNVEIWYVKRPDFRHLQTNAHVEFWNQFFAAVGARVQRVVPI